MEQVRENARRAADLYRIGYSMVVSPGAHNRVVGAITAMAGWCSQRSRGGRGTLVWWYNPAIYRGSAACYNYGHPAYSPELEAVLVHKMGLDGNGRLLDVGCGRGAAPRPAAGGNPAGNGLRVLVMPHQATFARFSSEAEAAMGPRRRVAHRRQQQAPPVQARRE